MPKIRYAEEFSEKIFKERILEEDKRITENSRTEKAEKDRLFQPKIKKERKKEKELRLDD
ncbi:hypothetical protein PanWU01x14_021170, partial [Parasponia andersonii]